MSPEAKLREALSHYARRYRDGKVWNWMDWVCDKYSGLAWHFDWNGDEQDEPWEIAEKALSLPCGEDEVSRLRERVKHLESLHDDECFGGIEVGRLRAELGTMTQAMKTHWDAWQKESFAREKAEAELAKAKDFALKYCAPHSQEYAMRLEAEVKNLTEELNLVSEQRDSMAEKLEKALARLSDPVREAEREVVEAAKGVDDSDGIDEGWKLRRALARLAATKGGVMDKYEKYAAEAMGHEDCPHWMDDNFFCKKCDGLRPVIAALRSCAKAERVEAFKEAARIGREEEIMVSITRETAQETKHSWGVRVVESFCKMLEARAAEGGE